MGSLRIPSASQDAVDGPGLPVEEDLEHDPDRDGSRDVGQEVDELKRVPRLVEVVLEQDRDQQPEGDLHRQRHAHDEQRAADRLVEGRVLEEHADVVGEPDEVEVRKAGPVSQADDEREQDREEAERDVEGEVGQDEQVGCCDPAGLIWPISLTRCVRRDAGALRPGAGRTSARARRASSTRLGDQSLLRPGLRFRRSSSIIWTRPAAVTFAPVLICWRARLKPSSLTC